MLAKSVKSLKGKFGEGTAKKNDAGNRRGPFKDFCCRSLMHGLLMYFLISHSNGFSLVAIFTKPK